MVVRQSQSDQRRRPLDQGRAPAIAREAQTYKTRLRPLIRAANLYHVLPRPDNRNWDAIEYYDPTAGKGVVYVFKPQSRSDAQAIKLKGLDTKRAYKLTFEDGSNAAASMSGGGLMAEGFRMWLRGTFVSELVWIAGVTRSPQGPLAAKHRGASPPAGCCMPVVNGV